MSASTARPPFIWSPRQRIDPRGLLAGMGRGKARDDGQNRWFLFRRTLQLAAAPTRASVRVTADGRYRFWVNGAPVGRGPVRCSPLHQRYDAYDLAPHLQAGENTLALLVHTFGLDTGFYETVKGLWRPAFGDGGLWLDGEAEVDGQRIAIVSDTDWRCRPAEAWVQATPRVNHSLGFIEDLDARALPQGWADPGFDDSDWDAAQVLTAGGGGPEAPFGGLLTEPFPILLPNPLSPMEERPVAAERLLWIKGQVPDPAIPPYERLYKEPLREAPPDAVRRPEDLLRVDGGRCLVTTAPGCDVAVLLDFGRILTGYPRISLEARGGEVVEIACSEHLPGEWDEGADPAAARITPVPLLGRDTHLARYTARPGAQTFERAEWCAIRYLQLVVRNAPEGLAVTGLGATFTAYPVEQRGRFASSDPLLDKLWATGAYTLRLCMHDGWIDCPSREQRQWLGDATVESLVGHAAFGPVIAPLNAKFLVQAAESQRPDGLTQMYAPGDHGGDGLLIPDWTLQWILNAADHYAYTADLQTVEEILPAIQRALAWFERLAGPGGLVADLPYWHFMDWAGLGRAGQATALNAQLAGAFRAAASLCQAVGYARAAERYAARAAAISQALDARAWDERRGCYVDMVDPLTGAQDLRVSQHANAAMALWGEAPAERAARALSRICESARLTFTAAPPVAPRGDPLDLEEGVVLANTFYSHFVYEALGRHGRVGDALRLMRKRFGPMLAKGATTLWESFEPTASLCHGFSASPTYQLSRRVLGVHPLSPGFDRIGVTPDLAGLEHAEGVVPTRHGDVHVTLERRGGRTHARVQAPDAPVILGGREPVTIPAGARGEALL